MSGWRSRGYLPHLDEPGLVQMITFRLADALPSVALAQMEYDLRGRDDQERRRRLDSFLEAGHGACSLGDPRVARLVEATLLHFDGERYRVLAYVVMPNHVHVLIETVPGHTLSSIVHSWKTFAAWEVNRLLGRSGRFWHPEYFDRAIRDERHCRAAIRYIHDNPVKAGLVRRAEDWPFSSAARLGDEG